MTNISFIKNHIQNSFNVKIKNISDRVTLSSSFTCDAVVEIKHLGNTFTYWVLSYDHADKNKWYAVARASTALKAGLIIIAEVIPSKLKNEFKNKGVSFIELSSQKKYLGYPINSVAAQKKGRLSNFLSPASIKLQLLLFYDPHSLNESFITLGKKVGVSSVMVHKVFKVFEKMNLILPIDTKRRGSFNFNIETVKNWANNFNLKMREKLFIIRCSGEIIPTYKEVFYGADLGAVKIGGQIKPQKYILYIDPKNKIEIMKKMNLRPDPNGNVLLYEKCWSFVWDPNKDLKNIAPPAVIAADLMMEQDPRATQIAIDIIERYHGVEEYKKNGQI